jgi:molybdenum cofactor biosynthesis protein B
MSHEEHKKHAPRSVRCFVITASDTRSEADDESGRIIRDALAAAHHEVIGYRIVKDDPSQILAAIAQAEAAEAQAVIIDGGTGISRRDRTYDAVSRVLEKRIDGFGELFRMLSYANVGSAAMLSRAVAGTRGAMLIFSIPGSAAAVRLAMEKLILPELGHAVGEIHK